jgi:hypothetical protein
MRAARSGTAWPIDAFERARPGRPGYAACRWNAVIATLTQPFGNGDTPAATH